MAILCITKFVDDESISPTQEAIQFVWCGYSVKQRKEGVENSHGWGMSPKRCSTHTQHTNTLPKLCSGFSTCALRL